MAAKAVEIAEDIRLTLSGFAWLTGYTIQRAYMPPAELGDIINGRVTIVPVAQEAQMLTRADKYQHDFVTDVAIHKVIAGPTDTAGIDAMLDIVQQTFDGLKNFVFAGCESITIENDPIQDLTIIQGGNLFASLIRVTCRTAR